MKKVLLYIILLTACATTAMAQVKIGQDTIECHIVGFRVGGMIPSSGLSNATLQGSASSETTELFNQHATMAGLYTAPWLNFGINCHYKYKSNWFTTLDFDLWFGNDNLKERYDRMPDIFTSDAPPIVIGTNGTDAIVTCYNRGLSAQVGGGKILPIIPKNPNSGIALSVAVGAMQQQTIFMINEVNAPQLDGNYGLLYDHQRLGVLLTEGVGLWFMSNRENLINFHVDFTLSQCWSWSTRDYVIDHKLGLAGADNSSYFDLIYGLKFTWMFPLKGKTTYDYYYF